MSRLWNRPRLHLYLGEEHLAVCEVRGLLSSRVTAQALLPVSSDGPSMGASLAKWLASRAPTRARPSLDCVLGVRHVRYVLLPWDARLVDPVLPGAMARALFQRQFQEDPASFEMRLGPATWGRPRLVAFVPRDLLAELASAADSQGLRLRHVEPLLPVVLNRFARRLAGSGERLLLVAEFGRVLRVQLHDGAVVGLQLRPWRGREDLERVLAGVPAGQLNLFAPIEPALASARPDAWLGLRNPEGLSSLEPAYAYGLCGVF